jgi:DNA-binding winged helix-turn-helix (wHTH) protein
MPARPDAPSVIRFGPYEADLHSGELRKNGTTIRLQQRPFQLLAVLLENPGRLVTREELRRRLWSADTFVDFDNSLNTAITKLREALEDSADERRYIETLARRGYRFVAQVEHNRAAPASVAEGLRLVPPSNRPGGGALDHLPEQAVEKSYSASTNIESVNREPPESIATGRHR